MEIVKHLESIMKMKTPKINDNHFWFLGLCWHCLWWAAKSLYGSSAEHPSTAYWQLIGRQEQNVSCSIFLSGNTNCPQPELRNRQGRAIILISLSKTTFGASRNTCLHVGQLVSLLTVLQFLQITWPLIVRVVVKRCFIFDKIHYKGYFFNVTPTLEVRTF